MAEQKTKQPQGTTTTTEDKAMIETGSVKGTRDFPPEQMRMRNFLFDAFKQTAKRYAFEEYDAPILELEELYKRKANEDIEKQLYNFKTKEDTAVSLRPEMTPSLARLVLQQGKAMVLPARWYTVAQCWRFETIQKGRKREHYQWNMDIIGSTNVSSEVELVAAAIDLCRNLGLASRDVIVKVNSRKVLQQLLEQQEITGKLFQETCGIIDKQDKLTPEEWKEEFQKLEGLTEQKIQSIMEMTSLNGKEGLAKVEACLPNNAAVAELKRFFELIDAYGYSDWVTFTPSIVRGLVYYTGVVFEAFDRRFTSRAIFGGGRYDELMTKFGSPQPIPCCGFGFGDCVIMDVLQQRKILPKIPPSVQDLVIPFNADMRSGAIKAATILREAGRRVSVLLDDKKRPKQAFSYADRIGADRAVFVAPDEWNEGNVRVKDLRKEGSGKDDDDKGDVVALAALGAYLA